MEWLIGRVQGRWQVLELGDERLTATETQVVVPQRRESELYDALAFMRSCEASGEKGADHPMVLHALHPDRYPADG